MDQALNKNSWIARMPKQIIALIAAILLTCFAYEEGINEIIRRWNTEDEYSHGPLLLILSLFFTYQKHHDISTTKIQSPNLGFLLVAFASVIYLVGEISSLFILIHYAFLLTIYGIFVSIYGINVSKHLLAPIILLAFSIPLPYFLQTELTINMQLVSSQLGVLIIKSLSIPAFLEGNTIDLGTIQLQVVEACAGLRYMFSLMSFGFVCAYIYQVEWWKRAFIFASTIPITIIMNSARIAITGVLAHHYGPDTAEGFTHTFQGLTVFSLCLIILFFEMWALTKVGKNKTELRKVFGLDGIIVESRVPTIAKKLPTSIYISGLIIFTTLVISHSLAAREEVIPARDSFVHFPQTIQSWTASSTPIPPEIISELKVTDYLSSDFISLDYKIPVNLYVAYYQSQRKGASPHSPKVCMPGGGWEITDFSRQQIELTHEDEPLRYNRAVIKKGESQQLVYYWFQQRGRTIANEYMMKMYLFIDAITKNRTDGSLVRVVTPIARSENIASADKRLQSFIQQTTPELSSFIPE